MTTEKTCSTCGDDQCSAHDRRPGEKDDEYLERQALASRLCHIAHKIMVLSGKGGVGKSTVAVNLAVALALAGKRVGLLDVDLHGPSVPKLLHVEDGEIPLIGETMLPVKVTCGTAALGVISIGFLLRGRDDAVIWRGPRKFGAIKQFLTDVEWGELDYLVVDSPPGTGDEPLAIAQLIDKADGAVVVTTPQQVAVQDVRRCIAFCRQVQLPVLGVVENMSGFTCPKCGERVSIFGADGGKAMAEGMGVPYLGAIPIEPAVMASGDAGVPIVQARPHSETARAFGRIVRRLLEPELARAEDSPAAPPPAQRMTIALPVTGGRLSSHFGHCEQVVLVAVEADGKTITGRQVLTPPPCEPEACPKWLRAQGATVVIAGGVGSRAQSLFEQNGVRVVAGAGGGDPDALVRAYLDGRLATGASACGR